MTPYFEADGVTLYHGDCLEVMAGMAAGSVDAILTDLPYGITACSWDNVIPFAPMWAGVRNVLKQCGVFVTTASQPFTSALVMSNVAWFKYDVVLKKRRITGFLNCSKRPMIAHESILIFSDCVGTYNPQMYRGELHKRGRQWTGRKSTVYGKFSDDGEKYDSLFYPTSVIEFSSDDEITITLSQRPNRTDTHPTQKPVALYEYLVRTYTNTGELVADICTGSGTTAIAAIRTGRRFVGAELEERYCEIAARRIERELQQPRLFTEATPEPKPEQRNLW